MDKATVSVSSSRNREETGMQQVASDLQALKTLYGLLHTGSANENLDETSRTLLTKMLDDSSQQALLKQAKMLSGSLMSPALERKLSIRSNRLARDAEPCPSLRPSASPKPSLVAGERSKRLNLQYSTVSSRASGQVHGQTPEEPTKMDKATTASVFSSRKSGETEMQQVVSDLQALKRLYGLLHNGRQPDENLDETSRALMMKMLDDATQQALLKQAKMLSAGSLMSPVLERKLSIQSNRRTRDVAEPCRSLKPLASPSPSLLACEQSSRLSMQYSTVSSHGHGHAPEEPLLARLVSYRSSSRSVLPPRHRPSREQRRSGLSLHRMSVAATSQHGTVTGSNRHADRWERTRHSSSRGDQSPSVTSSNNCRSVSREMSLGPADENLDDTSSRGLVMKMLDDASQQALLKQAKMMSAGSLMSPALERKLSIQSSRRTRDAADPRRSLRPLGSPSPRLLAGEQSRRLSVQYSTVSSRAGGYDVHGHLLAPAKPLPSRLGSYRSSTTALPMRQRRPSGEQWRSGLISVAATSQHGTVTGSNRHADRRDTMRHGSSRGDQSSSSLEGSSRPRSVSREMSLGSRARMQHDRGTARHVAAASSSSTTRRFGRLDSGQLSLSKTMSRRGTARHVAAASSSSTTRRFGRLDSSRLSLSKTMSRRGSERRPGRGVATPERSSSSKTAVTIHSRIRTGRDITKHYQRQAEEEEESEVSTRRRGRTKDASVSSGGRSSISRPRRRALKRIDSGSMYMSSSRSHSSSGAAISYPSTSPTVLPESSAASASYSPSPAVSRRRGIPPPVYAPKMSRSMRQRRRQEVLQRRVGRLRMLKSKIAAVFHHRHDHHHHHHFGPGQEQGPSSSRGIGPSSSRGIGIPSEHNNGRSPWRYLEGMFQRRKGKDKKTTTSRTVVGTPAKSRGGGGGGNMHALFDAMRQHLRSKRRAPASVKMRKMANRSRGQGSTNKMHWWQRLGGRRGKNQVTAGRPRRRLI